MHSKAIMHVLTSVKPWNDGWLESNTQTGWRRWWSLLRTTVESVRISGGMIVVIYKVKSIWNGSSQLLTISPASSSGYRLGRGSLSNVFWLVFPHLVTSSSRSVIHSFASLDDTAVAASPTLQELRHACQQRLGGNW